MDTRKTPPYNRRAIDKYNASHDRIMVTFPQGTRDRIKNYNSSVSGWIKDVVQKELDRLDTARGEVCGDDSLYPSFNKD